jgi:uncharacterized oxidoreductase
MTVSAPVLRRLVAAMFAAAGCSAEEADRVAAHLVEANLVGHDSHGVIRVPSYVQWLGEGKVIANQTIEVVSESESIAVVDGRFGLGQSIGEQAVRLGMEKAKSTGLSAVALRNSGHLGRIGDWPLMAAEAGLLSLHFVNTSGAGNLVAPYGGINRRLSANPVAAGVPVPGREPLLMDISACTIAEGKIRVALNKGVTVPNNCIIDSEGRPTNEPKVFYADPPGAILPIAGHKGYALSMIAEMFAGALTGSSCTNPANAGRVVNGMFSLYLDRKAFQSDAEWDAETNRFIDFVKSSAPTTPGGEILVPGEPESRTRAKRFANGIELDDTTWGQISATCTKLGVNPDEYLA